MPPCQKKITEDELNAAIEHITQAFAENGCVLENDTEFFENILPLGWTQPEFRQIVSQIIDISRNNETNMNVQTNSGEVIAVRHFNGNLPIKLIWTQTGNIVHILGVYDHHNDSQRYRIIAGSGPDHLKITPKKVKEPAIPKETKKIHPPKKRK